MSIRRKPGDWVWLAPNAGFVGESNRLKAQIQDQGAIDWCIAYVDEQGTVGCGDPDCREWNTLWTEPDPEPGGKRHLLCHVNECQMFDEKQE